MVTEVLEFKVCFNKILEISMNLISKAIVAIIMGTALAQAAAAEVCYNTGTYDQAYVPCVSVVDLGNGHLVTYDSEGNIISEEWK